MKTGEFLKAARINAGLRNCDVVQAAGVPSGSLSQIESGAQKPNGYLEPLCKLYGIDQNDVPPFRKKRTSKPKAEKPASTREVYMQIASLAARVGDADIALDALAKMEG